ncbi:glycosyltransferase family 2 protein [Acidithiobacillus sp. M4-SHS-6]|uniref:glycosyltransferase family 2 protein n=1 Tax=Acidithiobacillus sp. M4-SHS-6 TaxID=3383024 RepID=UPI0039BE8794
MDSPSLSVVYISKNAEKHLRASLESVRAIADEILLVDCGSTDNTVAIAESFAARVLHQEWLGFGGQRQFAVDSARHDWILMLDTDEILRPSAQPLIRSAIAQEQATAFKLLRQNYIGHKPVRYSEWRNDWVLRLFDRRRGHYDPQAFVHESWLCADSVQRLPGIALDHYSFASLKEMLPKLQRYAELNAEKVYGRGKTISAWAPMGHGVSAFLRSYFLRLGMLDGVEGAAIAWTTALGAFMKYAIALEMQAQDRDSS